MKNRSRHCDPRRDTDMTVNHSLLTTERKAAQQPNSTAGTVSMTYCSLERMTLIFFSFFFFLCGLRSYQVLSSTTRWVKMRTGSQSLSKLPYFFPIIVFSPCLCWYAAATPSACESLAAPQDPSSSTASWCCTPLQDSRPDSPSCIPSPLEAQSLSVAGKKKKRSKPGQRFLDAAVHDPTSQTLTLHHDKEHTEEKIPPFFSYFYLLFLGKALGQKSKSPKAKYRSSKRLIWWKISKD